VTVLADLRRLVEAATPGPWVADFCDIDAEDEEGGSWVDVATAENEEADAALIVGLRNAADDLLACAEALQEIEALPFDHAITGWHFARVHQIATEALARLAAGERRMSVPADRSDPRMRIYAPLALLYVGLAVLANWLASAYLVTVPFTSYVAPAGVFCIGAILVLRDWLQQIRGLWWTMPLVYVAGLLSWFVGDLAGWTSLERIAIASVVAFSVSETIEAVVFTPLRKRSFTFAVGLSATVGNAIDSWLFLQIAFGSQVFFAGNFVGKLEMIAVGVLLTAARRRLLPVRAAC
jgi:uncharacterized PurR-regulated membrane protein YhhQ (DUF165 family)